MADPCPICGLPDLASAVGGDAAPARPFCSLRGSTACYRLGFERLLDVVARDAAALKNADELLGRARELLTKTHGDLTAALELVGDLS